MSTTLSIDTITAFKQTHYLSRKLAFEALQVCHGSLFPPKRLKVDGLSGGTQVTYCCVDDECAVKISLREFRVKEDYFRLTADSGSIPLAVRTNYCLSPQQRGITRMYTSFGVSSTEKPRTILDGFTTSSRMLELI